MQLYIEDYLLDIKKRGIKNKTRALFTSKAKFKKEIEYIFREVDT